MTDNPKDPKTGGNDWALSEAEQGMIDAGLANDPEALALAMRRHTEATRNVIQSELVPPFLTALGSMLDKKLDPLANKQERQYDHVLGELEHFLKTQDKRFDNYSRDLGEIKSSQININATVSEAVHGLKKLTTQLDVLSDDLANMHSDVDILKRDHIEFRDQQTQFSGQLEDQGTQLDDYKASNDERWRIALKRQAELGEIIERKEVQIKELRTMLVSLTEQVNANSAKIAETHKNTLAAEITIEERQELLEVTRWLAQNRRKIVLKDE
jgi:chromosome segregation ATPase